MSIINRKIGTLIALVTLLVLPAVLPGATAEGAEDVAAGKPVTSDISQGELIFDGNPASRTHHSGVTDQKHPYFARVDLEGIYAVETISVKWPGIHYSVDYDLELSVDGETWKTTKVRGSNGNLDIVSIGGERARYVRFVNRLTKDAYLWLCEIEVYSKARNEELARIAPAEVKPVPYAADLTPGGAVKVTLKDSQYLVTSEFSLIPGWAKLEGDRATGFKNLAVKKDILTAETEGFALDRKIIRHGECVEVADTLVNKTGENLPVMVRHGSAVQEVKEFRLNGQRHMYLTRALSADAMNPTTVCITSKGTFGMVPLDDVTRVHSLNSMVNGVYGVADNNFVLKPKSSYTMRWAVFVTGEKDYYALLNAVRRFLDVNFTIDGCAAFFDANPAGASWQWEGQSHPQLNRDSSVEFMRSFFANRNTKYGLCGRPPDERYKGKFTEGPDWLLVADAKVLKDFKAKLLEAVPGLKVSMYFGNGFYVPEDGQTKYAGCQMRNADGSQADYGDPNYPLWLSIEGNAYAKELEKTLDYIMDTIDYDVYWDVTMGSYHFGEPWDGFTADIDPTTHKISRLKSAGELLVQPWVLKQVQRILAKRGYLIMNGAPTTETMTKVHFYRFTETGSVTNCLKMHLYTPVALGDHMTERSELDCYRWMVSALHYGCVYYWYHDRVPATHKTLTEYMFPITPVELGEGYIIGKERIITAKSGWFSFGDTAKVEAHFYGQDGVEVRRELTAQEKDGKTWFKVELAENESCALVRKEG